MPNFDFENKYKNKVVCGIDEAGLGPLAGPIVVASCIILNQDMDKELLENINDSKKITEKKREHLFEIINNDKNIKYKISIIEASDIDMLGLSNAWKKGVIESITPDIDICLIDGIKKVDIENCYIETIVKGDQKSYSIAAASIIAKVTRDRIMRTIHEEFPEYGFNKHFGYGTKFHMDMLKKLGPCKFHRLCFSPVVDALNKFK